MCRSKVGVYNNKAREKVLAIPVSTLYYNIGHTLGKEA
jgi:hypothetical protein